MQKPEKRAPGRPKNTKLSDLQKAAGVSRRHAARLQKQIETAPAEQAEHLRLKCRRLEQQIVIADSQIAEIEGKMVDRSIVREHGATVGKIITEAVRSFEKDWPRRFAGLSEAAITSQLQGDLDKLVSSIRREIEAMGGLE